MTGLHSNCTPEGEGEGEGGEREGRKERGGGRREEREREEGRRRQEKGEQEDQVILCIVSRFTFGISIDELALRYDTCLRGKERRKEWVLLEVIYCGYSICQGLVA